MSNDHSLNLYAVLRPGTTPETIEPVLAPILRLFETSLNQLLNGAVDELECSYSTSTQELSLYLCGDVPDSYETTLTGCLESLGPFTAKASAARLVFYDSGDPESAVRKLYFGPNQREIEDLRFAETLDHVTELLGQHLPNSFVESLRQSANDCFNAR